MKSKTELTDIELMESFKNGDLTAFEEIVLRYKKQVLNIIWRFSGGTQLEAEDLAQDVFINVVKRCKKMQ